MMRSPNALRLFTDSGLRSWILTKNCTDRRKAIKVILPLTTSKRSIKERLAMPHLAGDPNCDEREELQVAVPQRLEKPGPHGSPASRAAEPHLPDATRPRNKNKTVPQTQRKKKSENGGSPRERGEEAAGEERERGVLDDGAEVEPLRGDHGGSS